MTTDERLPKRRLQLVLTLGADTLEDLAGELRLIGETLFIDGRESRELACGGPSSGYRLTLACDPDMTGEQFRADLQRWTALQGDPS